MAEPITANIATATLAVKRLADLAEKLAEENATMRGAAKGILPDSTPVEDLQQELRELKSDYRKAMETIRQVRRLAIESRSNNAYATIKSIADLTGNR